MEDNNISEKIIGSFIDKSSLNFKNNNGDTPLHYLCKNGIWKKFINELSKKN